MTNIGTVDTDGLSALFFMTEFPLPTYLVSTSIEMSISGSSISSTLSSTTLSPTSNPAMSASSLSTGDIIAIAVGFPGVIAAAAGAWYGRAATRRRNDSRRAAEMQWSS